MEAVGVTLDYVWPSSKEVSITLDVHWDLRAFLNQAVPELPLDQLLVFTGGLNDAYGTSIGNYVKHIWPESSLALLSLLEDYVQQPDSDSIWTRRGTMSILNTSTSASTEETARILFKGDCKRATTIIQQASWLVSQLRISTLDQPSLSSAILTHLRPQHSSIHHALHFSIQPAVLMPFSPSEFSCWHPLIQNSIVASGYPVRSRLNGERGLELRFDVMRNLAKICYKSDFRVEGTMSRHVILGGLHNLLYPTAVFESVVGEPATIQWHFVTHSSKAGEQATLSESERRHLLAIDFNLNVENARSFVGYCTNASTVLGSTDHVVKGYSYRAYTHDPEPGLVTRMITYSINVGKILTVGANMTAQYTPTDDRHKNFSAVLNHMKSKTAILIDNSDKRAWLVPVVNVFCQYLHEHIRDFNDCPGLRDIPDLRSLSRQVPKINKLSMDGADALEFMRRNQNVLVRKDDDSPTLRDLIFMFWFGMRACHAAQQVMVSKLRGGITLLDPRPRIYGWDFKRLLTPDPQHLRSALVSNPGTGWEKLTMDRTIFPFFTSRLGSVIHPENSNQFCAQWAMMAPDNYLLGASISTIRMLHRQSRCAEEDSFFQLAEGLYWVPSPEIFTVLGCTHGTNTQLCKIKAERLSTVKPKSDGSPLELPPDGFVVFERECVSKTTVSTVLRRVLFQVFSVWRLISRP